jgi:CDP-L-myo-inositol myo-inositolphosphotransferase
VQTFSSTNPVVFLLPGADGRVLGISSRTRNARVAARAGASVVDGLAPDPATPGPTIVVPASVLIDISLFSRPIPAGARVTPDGSTAFDISTAAGRRHAAWTILVRAEKPTDGWIARHFNRRASRIVSFVLLSMGLGAGHASILTLMIGLLGAAIAARPGYAGVAISGIIFQIASILDGVDGEMARALLTESEAGARLDTIVDQITYLAFFIGITIGWAREDGSVQAVSWTIVVAVALVATLLRAAQFVSRYAPNASWVFIDRSVRRAADDSGEPTLRAAAGMFTLLRRDVFAVIFCLVSLTGIRALVPGLVAFGIVVWNFTFSRYGELLVAAAAQERLSG